MKINKRNLTQIITKLRQIMNVVENTKSAISQSMNDVWSILQVLMMLIKLEKCMFMFKKKKKRTRHNEIVRLMMKNFELRVKKIEFTNGYSLYIVTIMTHMNNVNRKV